MINHERQLAYTQLGSTDARVSRICFGTWQAGGDWGEVDPGQIKAAIRKARDLGINFFDTAQAYGFGASEQILGEALADDLRARRDRIVIATKGGLRMDGDRLVRDSSPGWLRQGLENSLRALAVDYVDVYQVHWPDPQTPRLTIARLTDCKRSVGEPPTYIGSAISAYMNKRAPQAPRPHPFRTASSEPVRWRRQGSWRTTFEDTRNRGNRAGGLGGRRRAATA
jgi:aryl-alcohol dehydrogenase-like predicted oxidoreductase